MAAKLKVGGDFLKGVGDDSQIIQGLIMEDRCKQLRRIQIMCDFEKIKVGTLMKRIEDEMSLLKLQFGKKRRKFKQECVHS